LYSGGLVFESWSLSFVEKGDVRCSAEYYCASVMILQK
jgi:hypothetical protein